MIVLILLHCLISTLSFASHPAHFVYPVAVVEKAECAHIYCVEQDHQNTRLFLYNNTLGMQGLALHTLFNPIGIALLHDLSGFSFIDNGRLRIKTFNRKTAKTVALSDYIHSLSDVAWIDEQCGYCSATMRDRSGVYALNRQGDVCCIASSDCADYYSPHCSDDGCVWFVARVDSGTSYIYTIKKTVLPQDFLLKKDDFNSIETFEIRAEHFLCYKEQKERTDTSETIFAGGPTPIIYLGMISSVEGFFVEQIKTDNIEQEEYIHCACHYFVRDSDRWISTILFNFSIPAHVILHGLAESYKVCMPKAFGDSIYYMDSNCRNSLNIFRFNRETQSVVQLTDAMPGHYYFSPLVFQDMVYFGENVLHLDESYQIPCVKIQ